MNGRKGRMWTWKVMKIVDIYIYIYIYIYRWRKRRRKMVSVPLNLVYLVLDKGGDERALIR